jgi:hypothetical protein
MWTQEAKREAIGVGDGAAEHQGRPLRRNGIEREHSVTRPRVVTLPRRFGGLWLHEDAEGARVLAGERVDVVAGPEEEKMWR